MKIRSFLFYFNYIVDVFFIFWFCKDGKYLVFGKFSLKYLKYIIIFYLFYFFIINFNDNIIIRFWLVFILLEIKDVFSEVFFFDFFFDDIVVLV